MTIHEVGHPAHAWRCGHAGCTGPRSCGAGYASAAAAHRAEQRHLDLAHHGAKAVAR